MRVYRWMCLRQLQRQHIRRRTRKSAPDWRRCECAQARANSRMAARTSTWVRLRRRALRALRALHARARALAASLNDNKSCLAIDNQRYAGADDASNTLQLFEKLRVAAAQPDGWQRRAATATGRLAASVARAVCQCGQIGAADCSDGTPPRGTSTRPAGRRRMHRHRPHHRLRESWRQFANLFIEYELA